MQRTKSPEEQMELFGFEEAEALFLDLWNKKSLAGSWLFAGTKGIGKATLAYRLAKFVLAQPNEEEQGNSLFGGFEENVATSLMLSENNPVSKAVIQRTHPGLKVVECALKEDEVKSRQSLIDSGKPLDEEVERKRKRFDEIRVKDIREAEPFLRLTAGSNGWRVLIIDAADDMNPQAANALLKSLEEPPLKTLMILISHKPERLLPTIRSRCRKVLLKPLKNNKIEEILKQKYEDISPEELKLLLHLSEGSLGKAITLKENNGVPLFQNILSLFKNFPHISTPQLYSFVEKSLKEKDALKIAQDLFLQWLGRVCVSAYSEDFTPLDEEEAKIITKINATLPTLKLIESIETIQKEFQDIDLDRKQIFINSFFKLQREAS